MTDSKRPGVAFWATVAVVVALAYPLSIGPVMWLADREMLPDRVAEPLSYFYLPLMCAAGTSDATVAAYAWYCGLWIRDRP
jgi:hypothetical protein